VDRCPLRQGGSPMGDVIFTLQDAGYCGAYYVKLSVFEIETSDYCSLLEQSQLAFSELAPVAVHRSFA